MNREDARVARAVARCDHHKMTLHVLDGRTDSTDYFIQLVIIRQHLQEHELFHGSSLSRLLVPLDAGVAQ